MAEIIDSSDILDASDDWSACVGCGAIAAPQNTYSTCSNRPVCLDCQSRPEIFYDVPEWEFPPEKQSG